MKDIILKIVGSQFLDDADGEHMEFVTEGKMYARGKSLYLVYDETELSGTPGCKTRLKLTGDNIKMKRIGEQIGIDAEIEFQKGKRYLGFYDTPYGAIEMEVLTNDIRNSITPDGKGKLNIDYNISLKGLSEGRSKLNIEVM